MKPKHVEPKGVIFSQRVFKYLLSVYPKSYRDEYGPQMAQVFRDQSRDAWSEVGWPGMVALWLRVLPDVLKIGVLEHAAAIKMKKQTTLKRFALIVVTVPILSLVAINAIFVTMFPPGSIMERIKMQSDTADIPTGLTSQPYASGVYDPHFIQRNQIELIDGKVL